MSAYSGIATAAHVYPLFRVRQGVLQYRTMTEKDLAEQVSGLQGAGRESPSFHTAMAHLYRGEIHRMTVWRQRLDITSNWGILLTVALATFTLGSAQVPHYTLLLGISILGISVLIEARRYRHLHHSQWRLYLMEVGYFRDQLVPLHPEDQQRWRSLLAEDLRQPRLCISWFLAVRSRLRRNYLLVLYFVEMVWLTKLFIHPDSPESGPQFLARFAVGELIPHWLVAASALAFLAAATVMALTCPCQEELENWTSLTQTCSSSVEKGKLRGSGR